MTQAAAARHVRHARPSRMLIPNRNDARNLAMMIPAHNAREIANLECAHGRHRPPHDGQ